MYQNHEYLRHLSITHVPPSDFNVGHGFEGNYLHRKMLYKSVLPLLNRLETFECPTFVQSIACYEQIISNLLWNGCKCDHCDAYLSIFDKYILDHQYYDEIKCHLTDMISPILFGNIGRVLSIRKIGGNIAPTYAYWDFHDAPYQISHFHDCKFDRSAFPAATTCLVHFVQSYVEKMGRMIPSLKRCVLSGMFYDKISENRWYCSERFLQK